MTDADRHADRMAYLIGGGRERVEVSRGQFMSQYITLFYETWFEWRDYDAGYGRRSYQSQAVPVQGYVVDELDIQHRFKTLVEADAFFETLTDKYATQMGLLALGIK